MADRWKSRLNTAAAIAALSCARLVVATLPFNRWRDTLGDTSKSHTRTATAEARRIAAHVERAARLLPFSTKCLPRAMALSWLLRSRSISHCVVFAVRPPELRGAGDELHAWVAIAGETIIGELPGPWVETLRIGDEGPQMGTPKA